MEFGGEGECSLAREKWPWEIGREVWSKVTC